MKTLLNTFLLLFLLYSCTDHRAISSTKESVPIVCDSIDLNLLYFTKIDAEKRSPIIADSLKQNLSCLAWTRKEDALNVCCVILLRSYLTQLKCCNQSYDLCFNGQIDSVSNPIVYYFSILADTQIVCHEAPSSLPFDWVLLHMDSISSPLVLREVELIQKELDRIERDL